MDVEGILAITLIFGGGTLFLLAISPIGRAIANRIQGGSAGEGLPAATVKRLESGQQALVEELDHLRQDMVEVQERLDFAERLLARQREGLPRLAGGADAGAGES
jgi:hypothetical protein